MKIKVDIGKIFIRLGDKKVVEMIKVNKCKDHIDMLVSIPTKLNI